MIVLPSYFSQEIIAKNARIAAQGPLKPSYFAISLSACSLPCALLALDEMKFFTFKWLESDATDLVVASAFILILVERLSR
ncbi:MAG: hypothetical protein WA137_03910 [Methanothrix sp.]